MRLFEKRRIVVVVNPSSAHGAGRHLMSRIRSALTDRLGNPLKIRFSENAEHLTELARTASQNGTDVFVACGGDGTTHYALQALVHSKTALGVIPIGSGNDLAVNLGIPSNLERAAEVIAQGKTRVIDLAQTRTAVYACIAGVGLDSEVNRRANARNRWIRGRTLYPVAILQTLISFRPRQVRIRCDQQVFEGPIMFAVVANAPSYGRGIRIAPMAMPDDGVLNVGIVKSMAKLRLLWHYPKTYRGTHVEQPFFLHLQGREIEIESPEPLDLFGDGEFIEQTPTRIRVLHRALKVVVPG